MNRNLIKRSLALILALLLSLSLFACSDRGEDEDKNSIQNPTAKNDIYYEYFDTVCVFYDYSGMSDEKFTALSALVKAEIEKYHKLFDAYNEYTGLTNIASLNRLAGTGAVKVDPEIIDLLLFSQEMYDLTGGKVNYAMGAVTKLWKTLPEKEKRIPTEAELASARGHISPRSVIIDKEGVAVEITDASLRIDVGAIAKGYTAERIKEKLVSLGYTSLVLDMGGNLCVLGRKPNGDGWVSGIKNPLYQTEGGEPYSRKVTLTDGALVTSGSYERFRVINGKSYHHIIDPVTLMPETRYLSVTIQTADSGVADALSTAVFNMNIEEAEAFVKTAEGIEITLIFPDGTVKVLN